MERDIVRCARAHCDQHVIKMILESVQILCTVLNRKGFKTPYRSTHAKHPCVVWAGASYDNFCWLRSLALALNNEYRFRYQKTSDHKSVAVLKAITGARFPRRGLTPFAQAMPEKYRVPGDAVAAYRAFYRGEKLGFATWTRRPPPRWLRPARETKNLRTVLAQAKGGAPTTDSGQLITGKASTGGNPRRAFRLI